jgi:hypothetical protein
MAKRIAELESDLAESKRLYTGLRSGVKSLFDHVDDFPKYPSATAATAACNEAIRNAVRLVEQFPPLTGDDK